jgi:hypothetical protein
LDENRLSFWELEGKVDYRYGRDAADLEAMNYLEFIARVTCFYALLRLLSLISAILSST